MSHIETTLGPRSAEQLGVVLPHEHVFVDLRVGDPPGFAQAEPEALIRLMGPELDRARGAGIGAIVEATPVGVGRRVDLLKAVSEATGFPLVVPTGIYREPWVPQWAHETSEEALCRWMYGELTDQIEGTGIRAGWVKLSTGDDGITSTEAKILRAAARAAAQVDAVIGSHTIRGSVVKDQLGILEQVGHSPSRFIWIHAQCEPDFALHLEMARWGVWIEYDDIGNVPDSVPIERIRRLLDADLGHRVLLSQDRGWYDAAQPGGGVPKPFTYIMETFVPALRQAGIDERTIVQLTRTNPYQAFSRA